MYVDSWIAVSSLCLKREAPATLALSIPYWRVVLTKESLSFYIDMQKVLRGKNSMLNSDADICVNIQVSTWN